MTTYIPLGSRFASAGTKQVAKDNGQNNANNWTVTFSPNDIDVDVPYFEVSHIVVNGAPGSQFDIFINSRQWDTNQDGFSNSWDPVVALPMRPGEYLYFYWTTPFVLGPSPTVTIWLRYDVDIPANRLALLGQAAQLCPGILLAG